METKVSFVTALKAGDERIFDSFSGMDHVRDNISWLIKYSSDVVDNVVLKLCSQLDALEVSHSVVLTKDESLYDGLNQAVARLRSPYFVVLGAGDRVIPEAFPSLLSTCDALDADMDFAMACFPIFHRGEGKKISPQPAFLSTGMFCPHPGIVCRTSVASEVGLFDTRYKIAADYDFILKVTKRYPKVFTSNVVLVDFEGGGMSEVLKKETCFETALIKARHFQPPTRC